MARIQKTINNIRSGYRKYIDVNGGKWEKVSNTKDRYFYQEKKHIMMYHTSYSDVNAYKNLFRDLEAQANKLGIEQPWKDFANENNVLMAGSTNLGAELVWNAIVKEFQRGLECFGGDGLLKEED